MSKLHRSDSYRFQRISRREFIIQLAAMAGLLAGCSPSGNPVTPTRAPASTGTPTAMPTTTPAPMPTATSPSHWRPEAIVNGTVIDCTGAAPIPNGLVSLRGNRIAAVGPAGAFNIPPEAAVLDAGGGTILPGIFNAHVHRTSHPRNRRVFLEQGVTTTADVGAKKGEIPRFKIAEYHGKPAARGLCAGPILSAPDGYAGAQGYVYSPESGRLTIADLAERGVDLVKLGLDPGVNPDDPDPMPSLETVRAMVEEAHRHDLPVHAHLLNEMALDLALDGGVDVIQHVPSPVRSRANEAAVVEKDKREHFIARARPQHARMVKQGVFMVPTFEVFLKGWFDKPTAERTPYEQARIDLLLGLVRQFHELGGIIALGNDSPVGLVEPGMPILEMQMLLAAGLTPLEVLEAGTRHAAAACGVSDTLGTLEPGKLADVLVVDGDPLTDIEAMTRVRVVVKEGQVAHTSDSSTGTTSSGRHWKSIE